MRASMRPYCGWYFPWVVMRADVYDPSPSRRAVMTRLPWPSSAELAREAV